ncbi:MAG TPA: hypothetical protein VFF52_19310, partial [Isosphaeraceae bacterium]|nr:hypothetical protein [Isosphaeraceae bacterium]
QAAGIDVRSDGRAGLAAAAGALRQAVARDQLNLSLRWDLASVEAQLGELADAKTQYLDAVALSPLVDGPYLQAAEFDSHTLNDAVAAAQELDQGIQRLRLIPAIDGGPAQLDALEAARGQLAG